MVVTINWEVNNSGTEEFDIEDVALTQEDWDALSCAEKLSVVQEFVDNDSHEISIIVTSINEG